VRRGKRERASAGRSISAGERRDSRRDATGRGIDPIAAFRVNPTANTPRAFTVVATVGRLSFRGSPSAFRRRPVRTKSSRPPDEGSSFEHERPNDDVVEMSEPCASPRLPHSATSAAAKPDLDPTRSNEVREYCVGVPVIRNVNSLRLETSRLLTRVATSPRWRYSVAAVSRCAVAN